MDAPAQHAAWKSRADVDAAMRAAMADVEARVVHRANGLWVVDKPAGICTSGRTLDDPDAVQHHLMRLHAGKVWVVHQLDADTTGVNLFVTQKKLVAIYNDWLGLPHTVKTYVAIVHGVPRWDARSVQAAIGPVDARSLGVSGSGKSAHTDLRVLARAPAHAMVEARIHTGRTHQVRIHLAHLGHPLVGEEWYREAPCLEHPRQALHALRVQAPACRVRKHDLPALRFEVPLAPDLTALARRLGLV